MARVRTISVNLTAGTAQFFRDLDQANGKLRQFGHEGVTNVQATSGALRVLEGNITNNLRAAERFVANIKGMGPLLQAAFPVVGAVALAGVLGELGKKAYEFYTSIRDAGEKAQGAFRQMAEPLRLTNDQLEVSNARLENEIAKLEGHHENTLKLALAEAREEADRLAESLDKDLANIHKVLEEQEGGWAQKTWRFLAGDSSTSYIAKWLGGETGAGGFRAAQQSLRLNTADKDYPEAQAQQLNDAIAQIDFFMRDAQARAQPRTAYDVYGGHQVPGQDVSREMEELQALKTQFQMELEHNQLQQQNNADQGKKDRLQAARDNAAQDRPFEDWMKKTGAEIDAIKARLEAIGKPEAAQLIAKAFGESRKAIEEVNKALERHNTQLTDAQKNQIRTAEQTRTNTEAEVKWKDTFTADISAINNRIKAQDLLTAAIGRGYEATKQANVEARVMQALGEHYGDAAWMQAHAGEVNQLRAGYSAELGSEHLTKVGETVEQLTRQIELEKTLAAVQQRGAEAVREAALAVKLRQMAEEGATKEQIQAEIDLFNATRKNTQAEGLYGLNQKIEATQRLTAAILQSAAAERQAALENELAQAREQGASGAQLDAIIQRHQADYSAELARASVQVDRVRQLNDEIQKLQDAKTLYGDTLAIEIQLRDLENERIQALVQESLGLRGARDGVRAFFLEMQEDAKSAARIVYDSLNSALDRVSENMAKMMTGHKTDWAKSLQQLGEQMTQESVKSLLHQGLGALGKLFGVDAGGALKPDGTREKPLWVRIEDGKLATDPNTIDILFSGGAGGSGSGGGAISGVPSGVFQGSSGGPGFSLLDQQSQLLGKLASMGILKLIRPGGAPLVDPGAPNVTSDDLSSLGVFGGAMASGGDVDPGKVYWTGEEGPEPFIPNTAGRILPHGALAGEVHLHYNIDARGADLGAYNRIMQGIEESHNSAIAKGVQAMHEHSQRTPQR